MAASAGSGALSLGQEKIGSRSSNEEEVKDVLELIRNIEMEEEADPDEGKEDEDSDWEGDEETERGPGSETRLENDPDGHTVDRDPTEDDDNMNEDSSVGGPSEVSQNPSGNTKGSTTSAIISSFRKIGVYVKRELNKRKSGVGSKRATAKIQVKKKETQELTNVFCIQKLSQHQGPIWVMEVSPAPGLFVATAGKDAKILIWEVEQVRGSFSSSSPHNHPSSHAPGLFEPSVHDASSAPSLTVEDDMRDSIGGILVTGPSLLKPDPVREYSGHSSDVVALSWSKSLFLASGSIDKSCRVWHVSSDSCLAVLRHPDFVTSVDFHPLDDSLILTGCFDKRLRLWDVSGASVCQRVTAPSYITACRFNLSGDFAVAGLYTGHCVFYQMAPYGHGKGLTAGMRYYTQIECRNKTGTEKKGRKITSIRFSIIRTDEETSKVKKQQEHMLVTTNESRTRLYNMDDFSLVCKYRGASNSSMLQIGASCSEDGRHIICGSEDRTIVIWRLKNDLVKKIFGQVRRDMCDSFEAFCATSSSTVTVACFAPEHLVKVRKSLLSTSHEYPQALLSQEDTRKSASLEEPLQAEDAVGLNGALLLSAGFDGTVGIFQVS